MDVLRGLFWLLLGAEYSVFRVLGRILKAPFTRKPKTFGSAAWAPLWKVILGGAWGGRGGIIVGKFRGRLLRYRGDGAVLCAAPMGSGKGVGIVIPNLIDYPGAVICTDPKGENAAITGDYRTKLGPVFKLDAITPEASAQFNPLDMVRLDTATEFDDALTLADLLVTPETLEAHWDTSSKNALAAIIMWVLHTRPPELRTLAAVGDLVSAEAHTLRDTFTLMAQSRWPSVANQGRDALRMLEHDEFLSVLSNTSKALKIWAADRIAGRLSARSDFDMMDVHRKVMTIYVMVPEDLLAVYGPFLRVMMGCAITALVRGKGLPRPKHKPLLLLDECQNLGRLDALARGVGYLREYARTLLIFQDFGRMRALYGDDGANSFKAASGAQIVFGVNDYQTARDFADVIGQTTVPTRSAGQSQANTDMLRRQDQHGVSEAGRYLIDGAEIMRMPWRKALVRLNTVRAPIYAGKVKYYRVWRWWGRYGVWRDRGNGPAPVAEPGSYQGGGAGPAAVPGYPATLPAGYPPALSPGPPAPGVS
jgi:type IV secretion system protein VirD4